MCESGLTNLRKYPPHHHQLQPGPLTTPAPTRTIGRMEISLNNSSHVVYSKFWPNHPNVAAQFALVFCLLLCSFGRSASCTLLTDVEPSAVFCCWGMWSRPNSAWWVFLFQCLDLLFSNVKYKMWTMFQENLFVKGKPRNGQNNGKLIFMYIHEWNMTLCPKC